MAKVKSPLNPGNGNAFLVEKFDTKKIIKSYKEQGLNVERFFLSGNVNLYKCESTGYRFYHPFSVIGDSEFYQDISKTRKNYYSERWEHKESMLFIKEEDKVLEIGSGFGSFLQLLKERGINAKGIELNPHAVDHCKNRGLDVEEVLIEDIASCNNAQFDVVCSFQVLEHIYNVNTFLEKKIETLKKGGKLIIGVPNNNPYLFVNDKYHTLNLPPHHAGLWNKKALISLENLFNLKMEKIIFEPLSHSYGYFIDFNLNKIRQKKIRLVLQKFEKKFRPIIRTLVSKIMKGRNILVVYEKI